MVGTPNKVAGNASGDCGFNVLLHNPVEPARPIARVGRHRRCLPTRGRPLLTVHRGAATAASPCNLVLHTVRRRS
jgi:hypothetical protein